MPASDTTGISRRSILALLAISATAWGLGAPGTASAADQSGTTDKAGTPPPVLRIGYQKSAVNLVLLKQQRALDNRIPGGPAIAGGAFGRQPGFRTHGRLAARLRPIRRQRPLLRRRGAAKTRELCNSRSEGFRPSGAGKPEGSQDRAAKRFQLALSTGAGRAQGRPEVE